MISKEKILQQGAEANIILQQNKIIKRRIKKSYRLPSIDEKIRKLRTRSEAKLLEKASKIIQAPKVLNVNEKTKEISMDFINGKRLSEGLDSFSLKEKEKICKTIGEEIAKLHDNGIIHGDLTTSNMILVEEKGVNNKNLRADSSINNLSSGRAGEHFGFDYMDINNKDKVREGNKFKIYFIDFGLGFHSHKIEDKAVDLHLLRQALEAKHFKHWQVLFEKVMEGYKIHKESKKVLEHFKKVEARGRYKDAY